MRARRAIAGFGALRSGAIAVALAWSFVPIALLVYHTLVHGGVLSGTDGPLAGADQQFYGQWEKEVGAGALSQVETTLRHLVGNSSGRLDTPAWLARGLEA